MGFQIPGYNRSKRSNLIKLYVVSFVQVPSPDRIVGLIRNIPFLASFLISFKVIDFILHRCDRLVKALEKDQVLFF